MADPIIRDNLDYEANLAIINSSGVRPIVTDVVSVGGGAEGTYTVVNSQTKRLVIAHESNVDLDIRIDVNDTATATSFPVFAGVYFVVEVQKDDVVHFFNTTGGSIDIHVMETM